MYNSTTHIIALDEPLNVTDIKTALGASDDNLGDLCTHANIREYARYKPLRSSGVNTANRAADWWQGADKQCGFSFDRVTTYNNIRSLTYGWTYVRPYGSINSPYRMADFKGYYNQAECPVNGCSLPAKVMRTQDSIKAQLNFATYSDTAVDYILRLQQLGLLVGTERVALSEMYFGVAFFVGTDIKAIAAVNKSTVMGEVAITLTSLALQDTATIYPFLSTQQIASLSTSFSGIIIPPPFITGPSTCVVVAHLLDIVVKAEYLIRIIDNAKERVRGTIKYDGTSTYMNLSNIKLWIRWKEWGTTMDDDEYSESYADFTVAEGNIITVNYSYDIPQNGTSEFRTWYVRLTCSGTTRSGYELYDSGNISPVMPSA